jgi:hypothetical protein
VPAGQPKLYVPSLKFNRHIGEFADQPYSVTGELLDPAAFADYCQEMLPQPADIKLVNEIQDTEPKWVAPKGNMD